MADNNNAASGSADVTPPHADAPRAAPKRGSGENQTSRARAVGWLALLMSALALGGVGYQWWQVQRSNEDLRLELAQRLAQADKSAAQSQQFADEARQNSRALQTRFATLEAKLAESQTQQVALESLYQTLLRNQGDWSLAEVEQIVNIAAQQLQLAGNVKAAIVALEVGDARLGRMSDPQLAGLRMVLQQDLERLKAVPLVDSQGISVRLERMSALVDTLPLAYLARTVAAGVSPATSAATSAEATAAAPTAGWRRAWNEFKSLVRVQQMEQPAPALLSPEHSYFLRENLKLRLQGARFAVASRDNAAFQADLRAAREWLQRYFDRNASATRSALEAIDALLASSLVVAVPDIQTSLTAIHDLRINREKGIPQ